MQAPVIKRFSIQRFRGIEDMTWHPTAGMNLILGGGNVGKTTVLEAIAVLLHPSSTFALNDADYFMRLVEAEFCIEAVISLPDDNSLHRLAAAAWPWEWDGEDAVLPDIHGDTRGREPVYKLRVRGTTDLELSHEIVQPDGTTIPLSVGIRRSIGVVRLSGDEKSDRDLRLIQGGGLDRLLNDAGLRARLGRKVALDSVEGELTAEARQRLTALDESFAHLALPSELGLGFVGGAGLSINALVGLTAKAGDVPLPLLSWGAGTRRLASLTIADSLQDGAPITLVDELERGLEPYRQRSLVRRLQDREVQSFVTTHSAPVIAAATDATLWYIDATGAIGELPKDKIALHQRKDPESFLSRLTVVAEGATEVGFMRELLSRFVTPQWQELGLHVTDGGGNATVLNLLEALSAGGLAFAGIADREAGDPSPGRWARLTERLGALLLRWPQGCIEENLIPLFGAAQLEALIDDPSGRKTGQRRRSLADRLGINDTSLEAIRAAAGERIMALVVEAAVGHVPPEFANDRERQSIYKGHASLWFKSLDGGRELAVKVVELGVWRLAAHAFLPLINELRRQLSLAPIDPVRHD